MPIPRVTNSWPPAANFKICTAQLFAFEIGERAGSVDYPATDHGEARVRGSVTMPRPVVPFILSVLTITFYLLARTLSHLRIDLSTLSATDGWPLFAQLLLIWLGYFAIRRHVYPVISGYRFITPTWPVQ